MLIILCGFGVAVVLVWLQWRHTIHNYEDDINADDENNNEDGDDVVVVFVSWIHMRVWDFVEFSISIIICTLVMIESKPSCLDEIIYNGFSRRKMWRRQRHRHSKTNKAHGAKTKNQTKQTRKTEKQNEKY